MGPCLCIPFYLLACLPALNRGVYECLHSEVRLVVSRIESRLDSTRHDTSFCTHACVDKERLLDSSGSEPEKEEREREREDVA